MTPQMPGKVALVTGAGSGIGRSCAIEFAKAGVSVAVADIRLSAARQAADDLVREIGRSTVRSFELDVREVSSVAAVLDQVWSDLGAVDILVNAAGVYPSDPLLDMTEGAWDQVLQTNLKGPHLCTAEFSRRLIAVNHPGSVVNISSGSARRARIGAAHYCTSKAGVNMLTKTQALELAKHHIRVNAIAPGFVRVDSEVNPLSMEYVQSITAEIPLGRAGLPADIASAVLFLCSDHAEWITGSILDVDGGSGAGSLSLPLSSP